MRKKICLVCAVQFSYEKFIREISKDLSVEDFDVRAVFNWDNPELEPNQKGVIFKNIDIKRTTNPINILFSIRKLFIYFKSQKFDLIQVHTPIASISARIAAKLAGCKCIVYKIHGFYFHENMPIFKRYIHILIELLLAKITSKLYLVSNIFKLVYQSYFDFFEYLHPRKYFFHLENLTFRFVYLNFEINYSLIYLELRHYHPNYFHP